MRVEIDKLHKDSYNRLAEEINKSARRFKLKDYRQSRGYETLLLNKDVSVEKKKKVLNERLHKLIVKTFSIDLRKIKSEKAVLKVLKGNIKILRDFVHKLKSINHYLEESFLAESGLIKKSLNIYRSKNPEQLIEAKFSLNKTYLDKLEHTTYQLIEKVILFDKKLLKGYKSKEEKVITRAEAEAKDISRILSRQSELLYHLEAKLPPPGKISLKLLKRKIFDQWVPRVLALLAGLETEYKKEALIFKKLKKNQRLRLLINKKIRSVEREKADLIRIKQKRLINVVKSSKLDKELRSMFLEFNTIKNI